VLLHQRQQVDGLRRLLQWPATLEPAKAPKIDGGEGNGLVHARKNSEAEKRDPVFANTSLLAAVNILNRDVYSFGSLVGFPP
jgi:hypothetical protein